MFKPRNAPITMSPERYSRGVALPISLVILTAMTILAVAALSGTGLNEKMASSYQQKSIAFEIAESAIASTWSAFEVGNTLDSIPASQTNNPDPIVYTALNTQLSEDLDQSKSDGSAKTVDAEVAVEMQYCGETALPRGSNLNADVSGLQFVGSLVDVSATAEIANSHTLSYHVARGYVIRPKTGRTGNCWSPSSS